MRLHSNIESSEAGEVTILAILECIIAVFIYASIGIYFKTYAFYYVAIALAPLSLLRTDRSSFMAWSFGYTTRLFLTGRGIIWRFILLWVFVIPVIRFVTIMQDLSKHPIEVIKSMPSNWRRQALCTDIFFPPEMFPQENKYVNTNPFGMHLPTFNNLVKSFFKFTKGTPGSFSGRIISFLLFSIFLFPYLLSYIYRITFKSTSIVYLPFVWTASIKLNFTEEWPYPVKRILDSKFEETARSISKIVLISAILKFLTVLNVGPSSMLVNYFASSKVVNMYIMPDTYPVWQILLVFNAALTWVVYYIADLLIASEKNINNNKRKIYAQIIILGALKNEVQHRWSNGIGGDEWARGTVS